MTRLVIDQGNSFTKIAAFTDGKMTNSISAVDHSLNDLLSAETSKYNPSSAIVSSVRGSAAELVEKLERTIHVISLRHDLNFPFGIDYETPETVGTDRLANIAGAVVTYPGKNILVVDCGTCITYSVLRSGSFIGGAIAPGLDMRFRALNHFTGKLPLFTHKEKYAEIIGRSTEMSIRAGVETAILLETDEMIKQYCSQIPGLVVLITGGTMRFFEQHLKSPIFAAPYLTLEGLHEILIRNEN